MKTTPKKFRICYHKFCIENWDRKIFRRRRRAQKGSLVFFWKKKNCVANLFLGRVKWMTLEFARSRNSAVEFFFNRHAPHVLCMLCNFGVVNTCIKYLDRNVKIFSNLIFTHCSWLGSNFLIPYQNILNWLSIIDWYLSTLFVQFSLNQFKRGRFSCVGAADVIEIH